MGKNYSEEKVQRVKSDYRRFTREGALTSKRKKEDCSTRVYVDYRMLNRVTMTDSYTLLWIHDTSDRLERSRMFFTLAQRNVYWQVELVKEDKEITAFKSLQSKTKKSGRVEIDQLQMTDKMSEVSWHSVHITDDLP